MKTALNSENPIAEIETHSFNLFGAEFSPDGKSLVVATREHKGVGVIDASRWIFSHWLAAPNFPPTSLEFSPDQSMLALACGSQEPLQCWDFKSREILWSREKVGQHAAFSPDSQTLVTTKGKDILLFGARSGEVKATSRGLHRSRVDWAIYSKDGSRIASSAKSEVFLCDAKSLSVVATVQQNEGAVTNVKFSPCGRYLASAGMDAVARVYESRMGKLLEKLTGHDDAVWGLEFSSDGDHIFTSSFDGTLRIWKSATGAQVQQVELSGETDQCPVSPDGRYVAIPLSFPDHKVAIIDWAANKVVRELRRDVLLYPQSSVKAKASPQDVIFSPDGKFVVTLWDDGKTCIWELG